MAYYQVHGIMEKPESADFFAGVYPDIRAALDEKIDQYCLQTYQIINPNRLEFKNYFVSEASHNQCLAEKVSWPEWIMFNEYNIENNIVITILSSGMVDEIE